MYLQLNSTTTQENEDVLTLRKLNAENDCPRTARSPHQHGI